MQETLSRQAPTSIDPSLTAGSTLVTPELQVRFNTFEEAQTAEKNFSDSFIEGAVDNQLKVGDERVDIKGYLDDVEATQADNETIANPEAIAGLYLKTTDMLSRNLKLLTVRNGDPAKDAARTSVIKDAKDNFLTKLHDEAGATADSVVDWCNGTTKRFPVSQMEYRPGNRRQRPAQFRGHSCR